ncbi:uncharacterized protein CTRU02_200326 [Colletotrichum truncatum]|uniref:Uncharacterized protein n=1 Tax=Colletotrichum truncatum TaxID=5467 RepID=A0ACC3ZE87_COLTU|nr:uncharacterized protein CTRU02_00082 [Colletotrichum truncatum]KAF6801333.1 hypothetical protein CTRU02_00082 [Colletotrichum truncatum]
MFDHFTMGMQAHPVADAADSEPHLSPRQRPRQLDISTTTIPTSSTSPSGPHDAPPTPPQPIDNLVHELSKQTLFPDVLRRPQMRILSHGISPSSIAHLSSAPLEADDDCEMDLSMDDVEEHQPVADWKRSRRRWHSRLANNPNHASVTEARLRSIISEKSRSSAILAPLSPLVQSIPTCPNLSKIEADTPQDLEASERLEVDEGFCDDDADLPTLRALTASGELLMGPSSALRKFGSLRFRGSAETALRCHNVVRHRPRMRKRKGPGPTREPRPV